MAAFGGGNEEEFYHLRIDTSRLFQRFSDEEQQKGLGIKKVRKAL
ncbi:MAG: hypothetical protein QGM50_11685 [Anaerolineae bacterium]|nr:hypothetical protein [Anaerolineae bacterium]